LGYSEKEINPALKELRKEDQEIRKEIEAAHGESKKIIIELGRRLILYTKTEPKISDFPTQVLLSSMKEDVSTQMLVHNIKIDFEDQFSQIVTRLDELEDRVKSLESKG
jgi:hypothetical protein